MQSTIFWLNPSKNPKKINSIFRLDHDLLIESIEKSNTNEFASESNRYLINFISYIFFSSDYYNKSDYDNDRYPTSSSLPAPWKPINELTKDSLSKSKTNSSSSTTTQSVYNSYDRQLEEMRVPSPRSKLTTIDEGTLFFSCKWFFLFDSHKIVVF